MSRKSKFMTVRHRTRGPCDPILMAHCAYCNSGFWYRPSMGTVLFNGIKDRLRVACGWCDKNNYVDPPAC